MSGFSNVLFAQNHYLPHNSTPYPIERVTIHLKELDTVATIYPVFNITQVPINLIKFLSQEYNDEISRGDTLPFFDPLSVQEFEDYWFGQFSGIMCIGGDQELDREISVNEWAKKCIGAFFIKSAYPGRCSHVCSTNFLVNAGIRKRGIGFLMCECFIRWAPKLGYNNCIVDLIFETNVSAKKLLSKCGFLKVGKIKTCAMLKNSKDVLIDSLIYSRELIIIEDESNTDTKHMNILKYLSTGEYLPNMTPEEKNRLRASAHRYKLINGKLYLKGKEVILNTNLQLRLVKSIHEINHTGINKTTQSITEKYYWGKVKEMVKKIISDCEHCQNRLKGLAPHKRQKIAQDVTNMDITKSHIESYEDEDEGEEPKDNDILKIRRHDSSLSNQDQRQLSSLPQYNATFRNQSHSNQSAHDLLNNIRTRTPRDHMLSSLATRLNTSSTIHDSNIPTVNNPPTTEIQQNMDTPEDIILQQTGHILMDYLNSTNDARTYRDNSNNNANANANTNGNRNATATATATANVSADASNQDLASLLNYYNINGYGIKYNRNESDFADNFINSNFDDAYNEEEDGDYEGGEDEEDLEEDIEDGDASEDEDNEYGFSQAEEEDEDEHENEIEIENQKEDANEQHHDNAQNLH